MSKIKLVIVIALGALISGGIFYACKKNENSLAKEHVQKNGEIKYVESIESMIQDDIIYFKDNYAIDIASEFIYNEGYKQLVEAANQVLFFAVRNASTMEQSQLEAFINETGNLIEQQIQYENTRQFDDFFEVSQNLYQKLYPEMSNNSFVNEETGTVFYLPTDYLANIQSKLLFSQDILQSSYSQINNMNEDDYTRLLQTAFMASYVYGGNTLVFPPVFKLPQTNAHAQCIRNAGFVMTGELTLASATFTAGLIGCAKYAGFPAALGICMAAHTTLYGLAVYGAYSHYNTSVENCNYRYGG